jgi:uncharacterized protein
MAKPELQTWHEGEITLQRTVGVADHMHEIGPRVIRDFMPEQHRIFFLSLTFVIIGTIDAAGNLWAGILVGDKTLLATPDEYTLEASFTTSETDPSQRGILPNQPIALLGIDSATRRRNRANGTILRVNDQGMTVHVLQSFGNCPQYITRRALTVGPQTGVGDVVSSEQLNDNMRAFIKNADTFFVATYADRGGNSREVDVSHRGGPKGFVAVANNGSIHIPDYPGNNYFNSLGNILVTGRAGLLFVDFMSGAVLQVSGTARVFGVNRDEHPDFPCDRFWTVDPTEIVWRPGVIAFIETSEF